MDSNQREDLLRKSLSDSESAHRACFELKKVGQLCRPGEEDPEATLQNAIRQLTKLLGK